MSKRHRAQVNEWLWWLAAVSAFRARAVAIVQGLPFPFSLCRVVPSPMATGHKHLVHIMPAESVNIGKLRRLPGQSLCKGPHGFAGRLAEIVPDEHGATCFACLEIAERLSIVERQAS